MFSLSMLVNNILLIINCCKSEMLGLYLMYAAALCLCIIFGADRKRIILSTLFITGGLASLAAYSIAAYFTLRHMYFAVMTSILALLILLAELLRLGKTIFPALCAATMAVFFAFNFVLGAIDIGVTYIKAAEREALIYEAIESGESVVALPSHICLSDYGVSQYLSPTPNSWENQFIARYYRIDYVVGISAE